MTFVEISFVRNDLIYKKAFSINSVKKQAMKQWKLCILKMLLKSNRTPKCNIYGILYSCFNHFVECPQEKWLKKEQR